VFKINGDAERTQKRFRTKHPRGKHDDFGRAVGNPECDLKAVGMIV
jgi:hypothetical protein